MITEADFYDYTMVSNGNGFGIVVDGEQWADESKFEIMQFTGLKDKNDKEIYEGDIVKSGEGFYEVKYNNRRCALMLFDFDMKIFAMNLNPWIGMRSDLEVKGNVYENPELLA